MNNNFNIKMIRNIFIILLCLSVCSCGGLSIIAGAKFKKEVGAKTNAGNASHTDDTVKLSNGIIISFDRPMGDCGAGITFFGIILPVIPVWLNLNSCENSFDVNISGLEVSNAKLNYNGIMHDPIVTKKLIEPYKTRYEYGKKFKFQIHNFWKFRMADDKAIIVSGKTKDGREFTQELPVKWGIMRYNQWSLP